MPDQIRDNVVRRHEIGAEACLNGCFGQCHAEMRLTDSGWAEKNHIAGIVDEAQTSELTNLPLVDRGLKSKVELIESLHKWEMGELQAGTQIPTSARIDLAAQQFVEKISIAGLLLCRLLQQAFQPYLYRLQTECVQGALQPFHGGHRSPPATALS